MERRLLLVFALTFVVILAAQPLLKKYLPQAPPPAKTQTQESSSPSMAQPPSGPPPPPVATQNAAPEATAAEKHATAESETVVENDLYRIVFSNRGGQVKSWVLKKFDDDKGRPLELVNQVAAEKYGYPLSLWSYDEAIRTKLNTSLYVASATGTVTAPAELVFEYAERDLAVTKKFRFDHSYVLSVETSVSQAGANVTSFPMWPAGFGDETIPAYYAAAKVEYQNGSNVERLAYKKVGGGATIAGPFQWAAVSDQYFAAVFLPEKPESATLVTLHNQIDIPKDPQNPNPQDMTKGDVLGAAVGNLHGPTVERVFVGPKALDILDAVPVAGLPANVDANLRQLVDYGWLGVIARPLFLWLRWTYEHIVHNWGWAIMVQTLIITLALLPLRISQMKSALKMQKVAPQIKAIQEKYKKYSMRDPRKQEMNQEVAALYKQEGVNPIGGCLPLIIQMPFLFAYYRMLNVALDLRHAHWLWIRDLSARDPYFLLPTLLVVSMLVIQKMTPQAGMDAAQQKMMTWMMPLMMGFIFYNLAAGLNLYYAESNLIMVAQQAVMNRTTLGREMREMMEKRARKKDKDK